jgi:hypothetical protein
MPTVRLKNINPLGDVDLPAIGREADNYLRAGEEFDVDAELAGVAPGTVRPATAAELTGNLAGLVRADSEDGQILVVCPGSGLLAQVGNYELVPVPVVARTQSAPAAGQEN